MSINFYFFEIGLQSHPAINSKARPTHYHVLYDENNFNFDIIQSLTYNFCYLSATSVKLFLNYLFKSFLTFNLYYYFSFILLDIPCCPPIIYARNVAEWARMYTTAANTDLISQFEAMDIGQ